MRLDSKKPNAYRIACVLVIVIIAILFAFPLYWILTGAFKTPQAINSTTPDWWPSEWTLRNFKTLFGKRSPQSLLQGENIYGIAPLIKLEGGIK